MTYNRAYHQLYKTKEAAIDKELGQRYRSDEALQGETFTDFKRRVIKEELQSIREVGNKVYPAWVRMPGEDDEEFRKRLVAKRPNEPPKYPAWKRLPDESIQEFKKRLSSKRLE